MKFEKIFLLLILPLTYLISSILFLRGFDETLNIIMVLLPAFAAVVSLLLEYKSFKELLRPFFHKISFKSLAFAIIFPLAITLLCVYLSLLAKQGTLLTSWNILFINIGDLIFISIIFFVTGLFNEYGWRGYLLPKLLHKYNLGKVNFIIGIVVVCYHLPVILILNLHYGLTKALIYTLIHSSVIFAMNYAFTYLYTLSKNVILPSIMASLWNNLNLVILGSSYKLIPIQGYMFGKPHIINGNGILGLLLFSIFAVYAHINFSKHIM